MSRLKVPASHLFLQRDTHTPLNLGGGGGILLFILESQPLNKHFKSNMTGTLQLSSHVASIINKNNSEWDPHPVIRQKDAAIRERWLKDLIPLDWIFLSKYLYQSSILLYFHRWWVSLFSKTTSHCLTLTEIGLILYNLHQHLLTCPFYWPWCPPRVVRWAMTLNYL